jgi:hypothetical protein
MGDNYSVFRVPRSVFKEFEEFDRFDRFGWFMEFEGSDKLECGSVMSRISSGEVLKIKKAGQLNVRLCNFGWALRDSNPRPSACKADALNQLS